MRSKIWKLLFRVRTLRREDGQDLVEYALVVALIAFAATSGMRTLASDINSAFNKLGTELTSDIQ
jgi:pilus assembly protein Flp/PilA